ncbi:MAG: ABC transporter ATP-binding protein [Lachnospiraceae bacterium]|nr:ABC transporter ATP-binding protein [Lachnospiraceae bacterium]MBQ9936213.1 ABC transporter ATP-binding protein [Lachnospiraceae bacterium]
MDNILSIKGVSKSFGSKKILDELSFDVPRNSIYGFVGKNGAGKTTTMKLILGMYQADGGEIYVNGEKVTYGANKTNKYIGYLPDVPEYYGYMKPKEYLRLCADITGMPKETMEEEIDRMLEMVGLSKDNKRIAGFSRGMKQRLGIAQALLSKPQLLICDEPTSALDPVGRKEILDILKSVSQETTVIFSTHILSDVERICDHVGILNDGKLAWQGDRDSLKAMSKNTGFEVEFESVEELKKAIKLLEENNIGIKSLDMKDSNLEDLFMEVMNHETV